MNAQSSRSHAIFSLTLAQKKLVGGTPPSSGRSSSPLPGGRSSSRLARFGGAPPSASRLSMPMSRPGTPSFSRGGGSLRPSSALGMRSPVERDEDDGSAEWVTVVSKFHFVDLAGSERVCFALSSTALGC
jgi:hypothetical protein